MHPSQKKQRLRRIALGLPPLAVVLVAALLLLMYENIARDWESKAFATGVYAGQQRALSHLDSLFSPVSGTLSIVAGWLHLQTPDIDDQEDLNQHLMPILTRLQQVSSALIADSNGNEYMLMQTTNGWLTRLTEPGRRDGRSLWTRWDQQATATEEWTQDLSYDPRNRPWYQTAAETSTHSRIVWTQPYRFLTSRMPGITASVRNSGTDAASAITTAFDVKLSDLATFNIGSSTNTRTCAFIVARDGRVLALPTPSLRDTAVQTQQTMLTPAAEHPAAIVRDTWQAWTQQDRLENVPFRFNSGRERWWGSVADYPLENQQFWIAIATPESALFEKLGGTVRFIPMGIISAAFLLSLGWILVLLKRNQSGATTAHLGHLERLDLDSPTELNKQVAELIAQGENDHLEFKSSVRWNYKAGRTGKEMEIAWLKTVAAYLNSSGGAILLGVADDGEILGLGHDGFANDDKALRHVDNLIAEHVGAAHSPSISLRITAFGEHKVVLIVCRADKEPAFLKTAKSEEFYVRTGPATRALSASEAMAYVKARQS